MSTGDLTIGHSNDDVGTSRTSIHLAELADAAERGHYQQGLHQCDALLEAVGSEAVHGHHRARVSLHRARFQLWLGEPEAAAATCDQGRRCLIDGGAPQVECELLLTQSMALIQLGLGEEALSRLSQASELADQLRDDDLSFWVLNRTGLAQDSLGDHAAAWELLNQALTTAGALADEAARWSIGINLVHTAMSLVPQLRSTGQVADADAVLGSARRQACWAVSHADAAGNPYQLSLALGNLGAILHLAGDDTQALSTLRRAHDIAVEHDYRPLTMSALQHMPAALRTQGRDDRAGDLLETVLEQARELGELSVQAAVLDQLADLREYQGRTGEALLSLRAFIAVDNQLRSDRALTRGRLLAFQHQIDQAHKQARDAVELSQRLQSDKDALLRHATELEHHANSDALTQLANRRFADFTLPRLFAEARQADLSLWIAILDLDHFKQVNDRFGHPAGDEVLRRTARVLIDNCRPQDLLARHGGEEFLLAMIGIDAVAAQRICERLRRGVEAQQWHDLDRHLTITISCGLTAANPNSSHLDTIHRADRQLYLAKAAGRNQVATESVPTGTMGVNGTVQ